MKNTKYKIVGEENGVYTIRKTGDVHEFTTKDMQEHISSIKKMRKEAKSQNELEQAKLANYKENYKIVGSMTKEELHACYLAYQSVKLAEDCVEKIKQIDEALAEYADVFEKIKKSSDVDLLKEKNIDLYGE